MAGVIPVIRVIQESLAATEIDEGVRDRQRDHQLHPHRDGAAPARPTRTRSARAQELGYAEADPTDDVGGADAAAKMAILARLAFHTPVGLEDVSFEGIEEIQPDDIAYAKELGLSLKLLGVAERRDGGISVRVLPVLPLQRPSAGAGRGPVQRGDGRGARRSPRSPCRGPARAGSRPRRRCSATWSRSSPARRPVHVRASSSRSSATSTPPSTSTSRSPTARACCRRSPTCSAATRSRCKSVVQRGLGDDARLVMVMHEAAGVAVLLGARGDRGARLPALAAARDQGDRGRVRR